jgi:hypothetical protein
MHPYQSAPQSRSLAFAMALPLLSFFFTNRKNVVILNQNAVILKQNVPKQNVVILNVVKDPCIPPLPSSAYQNRTSS